MAGAMVSLSLLSTQKQGIANLARTISDPIRLEASSPNSPQLAAGPADSETPE